MNVVKSEVLINLESVERNYLKSRKSGVDEAWRLVDNTGIVLVLYSFQLPVLDPKLVTPAPGN